MPHAPKDILCARMNREFGVSPSAPSHRSRLTLPPFFNPLARLLGAHHPQITACSLALLAAIDLNLTYYYSTATISPAPTSYRMHATPMPCGKDYSEAVTGFDRFPWSSTSIYRLDSRNHAWVALEHLHPWAERQLSKWALKGGLQACTEFFLRWHSPIVTCILALHRGLFSLNCHEYNMIPKSGTIHWIASG